MGTIYTTDKALDINDVAVGTIASPTSGTVSWVAKFVAGLVHITFTLTAARIVVTDDTTNGSFGSLKLADLSPGAWHFIASRQDYTAFASDGTGVPADAVFDIGVGTGAIDAAGDGVLTGSATYDNVGAKVDHTLGGAYAGTSLDACNVAVDGTATALDLNLNWAGTGATVDGNGWVDVTGTVTVVAAFLGDD